MPEANVIVDLDHDPFLAISQALSLAILGARSSVEAVNFMEFPEHKWYLRKQTIDHLDNIEDQVKLLLKKHTEIRASLKEIGY